MADKIGGFGRMHRITSSILTATMAAVLLMTPAARAEEYTQAAEYNPYAENVLFNPAAEYDPFAENVLFNQEAEYADELPVTSESFDGLYEAYTAPNLFAMDIQNIYGQPDRTYHAKDFTENYVAFVFGVVKAQNSDTWKTLKLLNDLGATNSLKTVFLSCAYDDSQAEPYSDIEAAAKAFPNMILSYNAGYNNRMAWDILAETGLGEWKIMPAVFILDKSRNVVYAGQNYDAEGIGKVFSYGSDKAAILDSIQLRHIAGREEGSNIPLKSLATADTRYTLVIFGVNYGDNYYGRKALSAMEELRKQYKFNVVWGSAQSKGTAKDLDTLAKQYPDRIILRDRSVDGSVSYVEEQNDLWRTLKQISGSTARNYLPIIALVDHSCHTVPVMNGSMADVEAYLKNPADPSAQPSDPSGPSDPTDPSGPTDPSTPVTGKNFSDVRSDAFYVDAVQWAVQNGVTSGTSGTTFSPNETCTRGQIVTFLWRSFGSEDVGTDTGFTDVDPTAFYAKAVKWAVDNGITSGVGGGKFGPNQSCTRAQIVTFLWRAFGSTDDGFDTGFSDVKSGAFYAKAVNWAVLMGITSGVSDGRFAPDQSCTRAQAVTFLFRANGGSM